MENMKLDDFVSQTLIQIVNGVAAAQKYTDEQAIQLKGFKSYISPELQYTSTDKTRAFMSSGGKYLYPERVEFDVAVTVTEGEKIEGTAGLIVSVFGLGVRGGSEGQYSEISRIKFSVPVVLPIQEVR